MCGANTHQKTLRAAKASAVGTRATTRLPATRLVLLPVLFLIFVDALSASSTCFLCWNNKVHHQQRSYNVSQRYDSPYIARWKYNDSKFPQCYPTVGHAFPDIDK